MVTRRLLSLLSLVPSFIWDTKKIKKSKFAVYTQDPLFIQRSRYILVLRGLMVNMSKTRRRARYWHPGTPNLHLRLAFEDKKFINVTHVFTPARQQLCFGLPCM